MERTQIFYDVYCDSVEYKQVFDPGYSYGLFIFVSKSDKILIFTLSPCVYCKYLLIIIAFKGIKQFSYLGRMKTWKCAYFMGKDRRRLKLHCFGVEVLGFSLSF